MKKEIVGKRIKELRQLKGISQEKLAESSQISLRTVQRIENGETDARGYSLIQIAAALNTTAEELNQQSDITSPKLDSHTDHHRYVALLNLSALSFLIFPLLGFIVPFAIWMVRKGKNSYVDAAARRITLLQATWCSLLALLYVVLFARMPFPTFNHIGRAEMILISMAALYAANLLFIIISAYRGFYSKAGTAALAL